LHAVVWRNWGLVPAERLAAVLHTTPANVAEIAVSMGLPAEPVIEPDMLERGYITLIRRNWHLLPYEQLTQLLDVTPEHLAFTLQEDDFLYIKLGSLKPKCSPVVYEAPTAAAREQAAKIKRQVEQHFDAAKLPAAEPRFGFISALSQPMAEAEAKDRSSEKPADKPRYVYSYFALFGDPLLKPELDPYPDGLLARLKAHGVNGVWMHVVLRQLAPGGPHFPEWGEGHAQRLANLKSMVARAKRHGIDIYLYMNEPRSMPPKFFETRPEMSGAPVGGNISVCTSNPRVRQWLSDSLAHVFKEVPDLGGIFTITASENPTHCASHGRQGDCPRCRERTDAEIIAEVNATMAEGVHRSAPHAKVFAWDWGWKGHGDAPDIIAQLPPSVWLMSVSEWQLPIERGGIKSHVGEYSMSAVGPGPRATRHWQLAKQRDLSTLAKVQFNVTWELASVPYLPVMDLVAQHCGNLSATDIDGLMLSWSLGGYPSLNLELADQFFGDTTPDAEKALQALAERHYGPHAAPHVRRAWTEFSRAFSEFPYHGTTLYNGPQHMGPANLLHLVPTGYAASMVGLPYDDLSRWRGPYPGDVFAQQFEKVASGWAAGLKHLQEAQQHVPPQQQTFAASDLRVAQAAQLHFASSANQTRFVLARDRLAQTEDAVERDQLWQQLIGLVENELELARQLHALARADSRLGYEASNHYFFLPNDLVEKVISCEQLLEQLKSEGRS
jgi:hypothetical protein